MQLNRCKFNMFIPKKLPMQSVLSTNPTHGGVLDVIKFVSDLRQFGGFLHVLQFSPLIKLTATIYLKYC